MKSLAHQLQLDFEKSWYSKAWWLNFLLPISWLYMAAMSVRSALYYFNILKRTKFDVPVIVVGNIVVGGTGKTPIVIHVANYLSDEGFRVGIASRGYKSKTNTYPHDVNENESPSEAGDEPYLLQHRTGCPVVVDPKRVRGIQYLIDKHQCNVVLCDDGLQHLALNPGITIAVHPKAYIGEHANCIPAGPLREPLSRLEAYDLVVDNSPDSKEFYTITQTNLKIIDRNREIVDTDSLSGNGLTAVTAIARPQRFIESLKSLGLNPTPELFPDHYAFEQSDFDKINTAIIMTEKDWVKCKDFKFNSDVYITHMDIRPCPIFQSHFDKLLKTCQSEERLA